MSEFKTIETQEELDRIIGERLARQKEKFADYDQLKSRVTELETQNSGLQSALEEAQQATTNRDKEFENLQSKVAGYETAATKTRIAVQYGLPLDLAERLQGTDEESFKADAERLAGYLKPTEPVPPLKSVEPAMATGEDAAWRQAIKDLRQGE